jgi:hypothetical protein
MKSLLYNHSQKVIVAPSRVGNILQLERMPKNKVEGGSGDKGQGELERTGAFPVVTLSVSG